MGQEVTGEHVELFGITVSNLTFEQVCASVAERIQEGRPGYIVTPNVDHVCRCSKDAAFLEAYQGAFLVLPDGMPIMWAARLLGKPLVEKLSGSDMVPRLSAFAAREGYDLFFLGAARGVAAEAARLLEGHYAGLRVVGVYSPPMGFESDPTACAEVVRRLREAKPDICFVALGSPKQELWMHKYVEACGVPVIVGIGAGLDFVAGRVRRAPVWLQRSGAEWLWRLCHEPRRLWRRYLVEDMYFFRLFWREYRKQRVSQAEL